MTVQTFRFEALDTDGEVHKGTIEAESAEAAASAVSGRHLVPLEIQRTGVGLQKEIKIPGIGGKTKLKDLAVMTRQFASMTASGLTLMRTLAILEEQTSAPKLREAIGKVRAQVQDGSTLSDALAAHPDQFPQLMTSTIMAGEAGGFLDTSLARVAGMFEADAALRSKIKSALTYPAVVLVFALLMGIGVIWFIVPVFEKMFAQLGGQLPLPTRVLVTLSHTMWYWLPAVIVLTIAGRRTYRHLRETKPGFLLRTDQLKLKLPVFGALTTKLVISRWARNLGTLLSVGLPVSQALEMVGATSGNAVVSNAMIQVRDAVRTGSPISRPLAQHPIFPTMVVQMLEVGEESGRISEMLDKAADFFDEEVKSATESLTSALEPLLVVIIGAVIGGMVLCLYLPMFSIYQHIQTN